MKNRGIYNVSYTTTEGTRCSKVLGASDEVDAVAVLISEIELHENIERGSVSVVKLS